MSKIKTLLTNGVVGTFRNGINFACLVIGKSKYLRIGSAIDPVENWDLQKYHCIKSKDEDLSEWDIMEIYKPKEDRFFSHFVSHLNPIQGFKFSEDEWTCIYDLNSYLARLKESQGNFKKSIDSLIESCHEFESYKDQNTTQKPNKCLEESNGEIKITTEVFVKINGELVDFANLTEGQKTLLINFGIL